MIADMPRKLPPFAYRETNRHGRPVIYFRRGKGKRVRLPDDPSSEEFTRDYNAALTGNEPVGPQKVSAKSLRWLVARYMESAAWQQLSPGTRKNRSLIFKDTLARAKNPPFAAIDRGKIQSAMDRRAARPAAANNFLKTMRGLFAWAVLNEHVDNDPTASVKKIRYKTDGFPAWTVEDVIAFCDRHSIGTRARLALELILLTGLRRSDIVLAGRQHLRGDVLTMRTVKTGMEVSIRLPQSLLQLIDGSPTGDMHFLVTDKGTPFTVESFGNWFRDRCREAGIHKSAHGLRKLSATLAAEGGAASHQLMAQFGWTTISQAEIYTRRADRARLGVQSSSIIADQIANEIPRTLVPGAGKIAKKREKSKS